MANQIFDRDDPPYVPEPLPRHHMELLRRDWSVRVLDAFRCERIGNQVREYAATTVEHERVAYCEASGPGFCHGAGRDTHESARLAAAEAVFPTLDRNAPNWPGEKP